MTITTSTLAPTSSRTRSTDDPPVWNRLKLGLVSTCPRCGHERFQHGYTRRALFDLLKKRRRIDAYCIDCNVCWPISESERRGIWQR
jgi:hypothetical protein